MKVIEQDRILIATVRAALLGLALTGCVGAPPPVPPVQPVASTPAPTPGLPHTLASDEIAAIQRDVRATMRDPDSARFGVMRAAKDPTKPHLIDVCGWVNGRNSYGGYTGERPFKGVFERTADGIAYLPVGLGDQPGDVEIFTRLCRRQGIFI